MNIETEKLYTITLTFKEATALESGLAHLMESTEGLGLYKGFEEVCKLFDILPCGCIDDSLRKDVDSPGSVIWAN